MTAQNFTVDNGLTVTGSGGNITGANNITATGNVTANVFVGNTANVTIQAATQNWVFDTTGNLVVPGNNVMSPIAAAAGAGGYNVSITAGASDSNVWNSNPGGNLNLSGGYGNFGDGGGGAGGQVNIIGGSSSDTHAGNVNITSGTNKWTFSYNGTQWLPGNTGYISSSANNITMYSDAGEFNGMLFYETGAEVYSIGNYAIFTDNAGTGKIWRFYGNGVMSAPGDISTTGNISVHDGTFTGNINGSAGLDIDGDSTIGGNLFVTGNINFTGNVTQISGNSGVFYGNAQTGSGALYAGKTGYTALPNTVVQITGDLNDYIQVNLQNTNHANTASMEIALTADDGTDTDNYLDMGIASSTWDGTQTNSLGTAVGARDGYVYVQGGAAGGNLILGTTTAGYKIKFNAGGPGSANTVASISNVGIETSGIVSASGNVRGGNVNTAGIVSAGGNVVGSYFIGNGSQLTGIASSYGNANVAANLAAFGSNPISTTGNITGGNVIATNIGNVAALNLNGNASTILYGNGTFGAITAGTSLLNGNTNVVVSTTNVTISTNGNASVMDIGADSRVRLGGLKVIGGNINAGDGSIQFATGGLTLTGGNLQLTAGGYIKGPAGYNVMLLNSPENTSLRIQGNLAVGASNTGNIYGGNVSVSGNVTVSGTGGVSIPNLPAFRVYGNTSSYFTAGTLVNQAVDYNQGSSYNNTTGIFTAPVAGVYLATGTLRIGNYNGLNQAVVLKNGATLGTGNQIAFWEINGNSATAHMSFSGFAKLAVGDTLRLQILGNSSIQFDSNDSWGVTFLG